MTQSIPLGPLMIPAVYLLGAAAWFAGRYAGMRLARAGDLELERHLLRALLAALLAARLAFVLQYLDAYLAAPVRMLDIRDGGWNPWVGLGVGAAWLGLLAWVRPTLRKPLAAATGAAAAVWLAGSMALSSFGPQATRLPPFTLRDLRGAPVELASFQGKPVVLNLWATWCPPCRREMPVLQQAQATHPALHVIFLNQGESAAQVQRFVASTGLPLRNVLLDADTRVGASLGHRALPTTLFFDRTGQLVDTRVGELSRATLADRLRKLD